MWARADITRVRALDIPKQGLTRDFPRAGGGVGSEMVKKRERTRPITGQSTYRGWRPLTRSPSDLAQVFACGLSLSPSDANAALMGTPVEAAQRLKPTTSGT